MIGARWLARFFEDAGCRTLFTVPGSSMVSLLHSLQDSGVAVVPALHEPAATAMADGYSRIAGLTPLAIYMTPGSTSATSNLYNALCDESPLLAICSQQDSGQRTPSNLTVGESDIVSLLGPVTRQAWELSSPGSFGERVQAAARTAAGPPSGPVALSVPQDLFEGEVAGASGPWAASRAPAGAPDLSEVVGRLEQARHPAIVVGGQVQRTGGEGALVELAEALGAPVFYEPFWNDRLSIAPHHRLAMGELTTGSSLAAAADVVLAIGCRLFHEIHPRRDHWFAPEAFVAHVNLDPAALDPRWGASWTCACSPRSFAEALVRELRARPIDAGVRAASEDRVATSKARRRQRASTPQQEAVAGLSGALSHGYVVDESVSVNNDLLAAFSEGEASRYVSTSGGSLGWSIGAACGVALASQEPVTCVLGDGAFFFGLQSLWNAVDLNLPITFVVFDNGGFGSTRYFEDRYVRSLPESERRPAGYLGSDFRASRPAVADVAGSFGLQVESLADPGDLERAYKAHRAQPGPSVLHVPLSF